MAKLQLKTVQLPVLFVALGNMVLYQETVLNVLVENIQVIKEKPRAIHALVEQYQTNKQLDVKKHNIVSQQIATS